MDLRIDLERSNSNSNSDSDSFSPYYDLSPSNSFHPLESNHVHEDRQAYLRQLATTDETNAELLRRILRRMKVQARTDFYREVERNLGLGPLERLHEMNQLIRKFDEMKQLIKDAEDGVVSAINKIIEMERQHTQRLFPNGIPIPRRDPLPEYQQSQFDPVLGKRKSKKRKGKGKKSKCKK